MKTEYNSYKTIKQTADSWKRICQSAVKFCIKKRNHWVQEYSEETYSAHYIFDKWDMFPTDYWIQKI